MDETSLAISDESQMSLSTSCTGSDSLLWTVDAAPVLALELAVVLLSLWPAPPSSGSSSASSTKTYFPFFLANAPPASGHVFPLLDANAFWNALLADSTLANDCIVLCGVAAPTRPHLRKTL